MGLPWVRASTCRKCLLVEFWPAIGYVPGLFSFVHFLEMGNAGELMLVQVSTGHFSSSDCASCITLVHRRLSSAFAVAEVTNL